MAKYRQIHDISDYCTGYIIMKTVFALTAQNSPERSQHQVVQHIPVEAFSGSDSQVLKTDDR